MRCTQDLLDRLANTLYTHETITGDEVTFSIVAKFFAVDGLFVCFFIDAKRITW